MKAVISFTLVIIVLIVVLFLRGAGQKSSPKSAQEHGSATSIVTNQDRPVPRSSSAPQKSQKNLIVSEIPLSASSLARAAEQASPNLQSILTDPKEIPDCEPLIKLTSKDGKIALDIYKRTPKLLDRRALVWALGYAGDEKAVDALIFSLTQEFSGKHLTSEIEEETTDEEYVLLNAVTALGLLAAKYESAFTFLLKGAEESFWKENKRWSSLRSKVEGKENDFSVQMLVGYCIQGLGQSGRSDVPAILQQFKKMDRAYLYRHGTDISQAAFNNYVIQEYGMEVFRRSFIGEESNNLWSAWKKTKEGKEWSEWGLKAISVEGVP